MDIRSRYPRIRKWYDALMSGLHTQTTGRLIDSEGKCCLGLYLEECGGGMWEEERSYWEERRLFGWRPKGSDKVFLYDLPEFELGEVDPELKIPENLREKADGKTEELATGLNDDWGFTFEEIAACVKETWPEAFEEETGT